MSARQEPEVLAQLEQLNAATAALHEMGRYEEAIGYAARAVELARDAVAAQHPDVATALNALARLHRDVGNYAVAEPLFLQAIEIRRATLGEAHPDFAQALNNLALLYDLAGEYPKAVSLYQQASGIARVALGETHVDFGVTLNNLAMLHCSMGEYAKAEPLLREALEVVRTALGEQHPQFATTLNNLAMFYYFTGKYEAAAAPCEVALEIRRAALGEQHPDFAASLNNMAQLHEAMGNYAAAEPYLHQSLEIVRSMLGDAHPDVALALSNLAIHHHSKGDYVAAEQLFKQALTIRCTTLGDGHPDVAVSLGNLAMLYVSQCNYTDAERLFRQAMEIKRAALGEMHPDFATSLISLASLYRDMGNYAAAGPLLLRAIRIQRITLGENHPDLAHALNHLALVYDAMGNYGEAEPLFNEAREIFRSVLGEEHPDYAMVLGNLALLYIETHDYARAEPLFNQVVEILRGVRGERHPDFAGSLSNLGLLRDAIGQHSAAEPLFEQALTILRGALGETHPRVATVLINLASSLAATGKVEDARTMMEQALAIHDRVLGHVFAMSSEHQRWAYLDSIRIDHDRFLSLVSQHLSHSPEAVCAAFSLVLRRKGLTAAAVATQRDAVLGGRYPEVVPLLQELTTLRAQIARKTLDGAGKEGGQAHQEMLMEWNTRRERLEGDVARLIPEMNLEQELRDIDPCAVAMAMPEGTVLIEFVSFFVCNFAALPARGDREWESARYLAFVMPAGEPENVAMIDLGEAEVIDRMIAILRLRIDARRDPDSVGNQLREVLFAPLMAALGDRKRLLIAPDVDLARLPFEVLPMDDGRRLIDEYHISYLSAGRDLLRFNVVSECAPTRSLVIADPDFDLSTTVVEPASAGRRMLDLKGMGIYCNRLRGTRVEGEAVAALLGAELWTGAAALDGRLKQCHSPRILHVATHGLFFEDATRDPYQTRSRFDAVGSSDGGVDHGGGSLVENPLLRSGLALAGINTWFEHGELMEDAEDGLLTAEDATGLDLLGSELVVLSACETGLGDLSVGEGVFGLRRAFVLAGARTLVMSLWKVPDDQTQELMEDFYRRMLGTDGEPPQPRAEALRAAQLAVKARHSHPYYWGAFICQGYGGVLSGCGV